MLVNIDTLTKLTGSTRRTIQSKCVDLQPTIGRHNEHLYESKDALPLILNITKKNNKTLESERTRLASAQAEKTELEVEVIKGSLIPSANVEEVVNGMVSSFRSRMLSLPTKVSHVVVAMADPLAAEETIREHVNEALTELSEYDSEQYCSSNDKQSGKASSSSSSADSKPVGGPKKKAVKRGKQRTRTVEH